MLLCQNCWEGKITVTSVRTEATLFCFLSMKRLRSTPSEFVSFLLCDYFDPGEHASTVLPWRSLKLSPRGSGAASLQTRSPRPGSGLRALSLLEPPNRPDEVTLPSRAAGRWREAEPSLPVWQLQQCPRSSSHTLSASHCCVFT